MNENNEINQESNQGLQQETHQDWEQIEEPVTKPTNQVPKQSWWKKLNQKMTFISVLFLLIGFAGGYQVSSMVAKHNQVAPNANDAGQTNGTMQKGNGGGPTNGEAPPDRPDATSGASENQESSGLDEGTTGNTTSAIKQQTTDTQHDETL